MHHELSYCAMELDESSFGILSSPHLEISSGLRLWFVIVIYILNCCENFHIISFLPVYTSEVSVILTLLVPFNRIDGDAPLMEMFAIHGFLPGKYIVAVGAVAGLTVSLLGSLFPMPRVIYAMAGDGLLFRYMCICFLFLCYACFTNFLSQVCLCYF